MGAKLARMCEVGSRCYRRFLRVDGVIKVGEGGRGLNVVTR